MEKVSGARIADLDRKKYLVPGDLTGDRTCRHLTAFEYLRTLQLLHVNVAYM